MSEPVIAALTVARAELLRRLSALQPGDWEKSTPCSEWDTRQLVNHVVGVQFRVGRLLAGGRRDEYIATREDDWLGQDHLAAWTQATADLDTAIVGLESLDVGVDYRVPLPARELLRLTVFDTTVHTWDISRAIGFDEEIDADVARFAREALEDLVRMSALTALFTPPSGKPPVDTSDQELLLHLAGRQY